MVASTVSAIIFIFGIATCSAARVTCPSAEDVSPCICEADNEVTELVLSCDEPSITVSQIKKALTAMKQKKDIVVIFDGLNLGTLPSDLFEDLSVKKIEISHCELDSLTDGRGPALRGLENSLKELDIMSSFNEDNVPAKLSLGHLRSLTDLHVAYNSISEVGNDWFERAPESLIHLSFSNNGIQKLGDRAFSNLSNLKSLSIDGNRFGDIKRSMLPASALKLDTLEADNNALIRIPQDFFVNMPSLQKVSLRTNGITRLEEKTWSPVWSQLQVIYLEGNPLECDDHMNWLFRTTTTKSIFGKCQSPRNREGKDLMDIIRNN